MRVGSPDTMGTAQVIRANARDLPLADDSVDLVVTSPPYFALRSYQDAGEHYLGQIGDEATPAEFVDALIEVTRECMRVLKPSGSLWVNLGDKYSGAQQQSSGRESTMTSAEYWSRTNPKTTGVKAKSLYGIPWRYALRCIDDLGLILRAEVIWSKPNGLPESVTDRVRRSHEQWFHFTLNPRYYSAVDEIRAAHSSGEHGRVRHARSDRRADEAQRFVTGTTRELPPQPGDDGAFNPLGKLPGSVWTIKEELWDHVLSGPMRFCPRCGRDLTAGPSSAITTRTATPPSTSPESESDEPPDSSMKSSSDPSLTDSPSTTSAATSKRTSGDETLPTDATTARAATTTRPRTPTPAATEGGSVGCVCETGLPPIEHGSVWVVPTEPLRVPDHLGVDHFAAFPTEWPKRIIRGWSPAGVCVECGEGRRPVSQRESRDYWPNEPTRHGTAGAAAAGAIRMGDPLTTITGYACACPEPTADTAPGVVLDPFGGTGTTAMVAKALGRHGITVDMSADYCRLARWRTNDRGQLAKVLGIAKTDREPADAPSLFDLIDGGAA